jgi:hypothetical protein
MACHVILDVTGCGCHLLVAALKVPRRLLCSSVNPAQLSTAFVTVVTVVGYVVSPTN